MGYVDAFKAIESLFTEATPISSPEVINQAGEYILFDGSHPSNASEDTLSFILVISANSYTKENGLAKLIEEKRKRITETTFDISLKKIQRAAIINTTLFSVAMHLEIKINTKVKE